MRARHPFSTRFHVLQALRAAIAEKSLTPRTGAFASRSGRTPRRIMTPRSYALERRAAAADQQQQYQQQQAHWQMADHPGQEHADMHAYDYQNSGMDQREELHNFGDEYCEPTSMEGNDPRLNIQNVSAEADSRSTSRGSQGSKEVPDLDGNDYRKKILEIKRRASIMTEERKRPPGATETEPIQASHRTKE